MSHQFLKIIAGSLISILLQSASIALVLGYVQTWITSKTLQPLDLWLKGISIALIFSGALALLDRLIAPSLSPQFAEYGQLGSYLPVFGSALSVIHVLVNGIAIVLLFFVFADRFTATGSKRGILGILFFLLLGLSLAGLEEIDSVRYWAVSGVIAGFLLWGIYRFVARFGLLCLAVSVATVIILGAIVQAAYRPFPYAVLADLIQILTVCGLTYWSIRKLSGQQIRPTAMSD